MDTLSIWPAVDLMRPAFFPFFSTLLLLWLSSRFSRSNSWPLTGDLIVLSGIFLAFFLFDRPSILHLANPSRPMDWIPALALLSFAFRWLLKRHSPWIPESLTLVISSLILLFPLLRRHPSSGSLLLAEIIGLWLLVQILPVRSTNSGLARPALAPIFLTTATLGALSPLSGSLLLGQLAGGLSAVWLAMLLSPPGRIPLRGAEPGIALGGLLLVGREYVDISFYVIGALYLALLFGSLTQRILTVRPALPAPLRALVPSLVSLVFLGLAVAKTLQASQGAGSGY